MTIYEKKEILNQARQFLSEKEIQKLGSVLDSVDGIKSVYTNFELLDMFETAKSVEGCSKKSLKYYTYIITDFLKKTSIPVKDITTDDIRNYLNSHSVNLKGSKVSMDNIRRVLSSFFSWLENEDYIRKNPVKRIHKIKCVKIIKKALSDENIENLKDNCTYLRNKVIIEFLSSTGIRVGELVTLNKSDIDFENKECIVLGKGGKQRKVYFDSKTKIHLMTYLSARTDNNEALFVSLFAPFNRLKISGVEIMLRKLGQKLLIDNVHPHRFRRTLATKAIDKGMPVEQVQLLLGHTKIDTTMHYAIIDQNNVKNSYRKFLG